MWIIKEKRVIFLRSIFFLLCLCGILGCVSETGSKINKVSATAGENKEKEGRTTVREVLAPIFEVSSKNFNDAGGFLNSKLRIFDNFANTQIIVIATTIIAIVALCIVLISGVFI